MQRGISCAVLALVTSGRVASTAAEGKKAPALDGCAKRTPISLGPKVAADRNVTYDLDSGDLRVCVDKAVYPYASGRGHRLLSCVRVGTATKIDRFCGEGSTYTDFGGYRVSVTLRTPRFSGSSEVWLQIDRQAPAAKTARMRGRVTK
jgi:hypothetical protein